MVTKGYKLWERKWESKRLNDFDRFVCLKASNCKGKYSTNKVYRNLKRAGLKPRYKISDVHKSLSKARRYNLI